MKRRQSTASCGAENSPSTAGNAALRMDAVARRFDQLADAQNLLAEHSASAATSPATQTAARADLAERQRLLAQAIRAAGPLESQGDTADSGTRRSRDALGASDVGRIA